jgi:Protein of unknown function (DUF1565)
VRAAGTFLVFLSAACGFPRPPDVDGDAADADTIVRVSPGGDDANDGVVQPVRTIKHAIGLAAANAKITSIALATGTYGTLTGETFPYVVPANVVITGPAGGGAILVGTKTEPGLTVGAGGLRDLDLQNFTTAVTATGAASLKNVRLLGSMRGLQAETTAQLTVENLEIEGAPGACASGILLLGSSVLTVTNLATRNLETALTASDASDVNVAKANISGDRTCAQTSAEVVVTSSRRFIIKDSLLDNGAYGVFIAPRASSLDVLISNTIIRNMKFDALGARAPAAAPIPFHMIGGEMSNSGQSGAQLLTGVWRLTDVRIQQNTNLAIYLQDGTLIMRGCKVIGNGFGINVFDNASADLGTSSNPGNNEFRNNTDVALLVDGTTSGTIVEAVGNTWRPSVQGADENGKYLMPQTISGPLPSSPGNNYAVGNGRSVRR